MNSSLALPYVLSVVTEIIACLCFDCHFFISLTPKITKKVTIYPKPISLLSHSFGTPSPKFERCQQCFLKNVFYVPSFASLRLILKLSGLNSIESEIALRKLLFFGRMITENKLTPTVRNLFHYRVDSFFNESISSQGILPSICEDLHRYELFDYFESWFHSLIQLFLITRLGK